MSIAAIGSNANSPQAMTTQPGGTQGTNSNSSTNTATSEANSIGGTFLTLLTQELQNQDPTAPMDSTQMVGQMISLNQLNELSSINQLLTQQFGSSSTSAGSQAGSGAVSGTGH